MPQYTRYTVTPRKLSVPVWVRVLKVTVLVIVVAVAATFGMAFGYLQNTVTQVSHHDAPTVKKVKKELTVTRSPHDPVNILVLGSDQRRAISAHDTVCLSASFLAFRTIFNVIGSRVETATPFSAGLP